MKSKEKKTKNFKLHEQIPNRLKKAEKIYKENCTERTKQQSYYMYVILRNQVKQFFRICIFISIEASTIDFHQSKTDNNNFYI